MSVEIAGSDGALQAGTPKTLFETLPPNLLGYDFFDAAPAGERFLMNLPLDQSTRPLDLIVNWAATLKR